MTYKFIYPSELHEYVGWQVEVTMDLGWGDYGYQRGELAGVVDDCAYFIADEEDRRSIEERGGNLSHLGGVDLSILDGVRVFYRK